LSSRLQSLGDFAGFDCARNKPDPLRTLVNGGFAASLLRDCTAGTRAALRRLTVSAHTSDNPYSRLFWRRCNGGILGRDDAPYAVASLVNVFHACD